MLEDNISNLTVNNNQESPEGSQNQIEHGNLRHHNSEGPIVLYDMNNVIIMMPTKFSEALRAEHYGYVFFFLFFSLIYH